eukprot:364489-Chlamydomonas_euryale.AAC.2
MRLSAEPYLRPPANRIDGNASARRQRHQSSYVHTRGRALEGHVTVRSGVTWTTSTQVIVTICHRHCQLKFTPACLPVYFTSCIAWQCASHTA